MALHCVGEYGGGAIQGQGQSLPLEVSAAFGRPRRRVEVLASCLACSQRDLPVSKVDTKMLASGPVLSAIAPVILGAWLVIPK
jgi:hypothetical protein